MSSNVEQSASFSYIVFSVRVLDILSYVITLIKELLILSFTCTTFHLDKIYRSKDMMILVNCGCSGVVGRVRHPDMCGLVYVRRD